MIDSARTPALNVELNIAKPADAKQVSKLHAASMPKPWTASEWHHYLSDPHIRCTLATEGAEALGFVATRQVADEAEVLMIAVAPDSRRRGIASALMHRVAADLTQSPARQLFLEVSTNNHAARDLYSSLGFHQIGRRPGYYQVSGVPPQDALVLALRLPFHSAQSQDS